MGLDMYLSRRIYVKNWDHTPEDRRFQIDVQKGGKPYPDFNPSKVKYVIEEAAQWRKANQIHAWFVKNVQGGKDECVEHYVEKAELKALVDACKQVLADHGLAEELLPAQAGFFFGGTSYDEYYFSDLEDTVAMLQPIIDREDDDAEYLYRSSW